MIAYGTIGNDACHLAHHTLAFLVVAIAVEAVSAVTCPVDATIKGKEVDGAVQYEMCEVRQCIVHKCVDMITYEKFSIGNVHEV